MFKIDALLKEVVGSRTLPALHLGVTSSTQVLYEACAGQRAYGEGGEVDGKTSKRV
jgi:hypothetical protein